MRKGWGVGGRVEGGGGCRERDGIQGGNCWKSDTGRGLWGKEIRGGDCGERDEGRGMWGSGYGNGSTEGTVGTGMQRVA